MTFFSLFFDCVFNDKSSVKWSFSASHLHMYMNNFKIKYLCHILWLIQAVRTGVFDVLPAGSLDGLTAEDLRLLLNGVGDINVAVLISYTSFNDESGESSERLLKFKRWLWSIVEKMSHIERQDLVSTVKCWCT
jgi:hypothetical protein